MLTLKMRVLTLKIRRLTLEVFVITLTQWRLLEALRLTLE